MVSLSHTVGSKKRESIYLRIPCVSTEAMKKGGY